MMGPSQRAALSKGLSDLGNVAGLIGDRSKIDAIKAEIQDVIDNAEKAEAGAIERINAAKASELASAAEANERSLALDAREGAVAAREADVAAREAAVSEREAGVTEAEADLNAGQDRLAADVAASIVARSESLQVIAARTSALDDATAKANKDRAAADKAFDLKIANADAALLDRARRLAEAEADLGARKSAFDKDRASLDARIAKINEAVA